VGSFKSFAVQVKAATPTLKKRALERSRSRVTSVYRNYKQKNIF